jgi:exonuclease-1
MLRLLRTKGVKPICVFDGFHLQAKKATEEERDAFKKKNRAQGQDADNQGNCEDARKHFSRSLVLRTRMVDVFMDILKELELPFLVAPFEADAQMAFMVKSGQADFAISEDSDLIAYGCPNVVMKLSPVGSCVQFTFAQFYKFKAEGKEYKEISVLQKLTPREFILACVMSGCEYLPNIERVGLKVALKHFGVH